MDRATQKLDIGRAVGLHDRTLPLFDGQVGGSLNLISLNAPTAAIAEAQKRFNAGGVPDDAPAREPIRQRVAGLVEFTLCLKGTKA
ncbi:MAG TPA: hypothetical protein VN802_15675 [Stellaceae bacterium]|nr:hypothetical protein [Stellaceae bacterium]